VKQLRRKDSQLVSRTKLLAGRLSPSSLIASSLCSWLHAAAAQGRVTSDSRSRRSKPKDRVPVVYVPSHSRGVRMANSSSSRSVHFVNLLVLIVGNLAVLSLKGGLAALVELKSGDHAVAGVDGELGLLTVLLLLNDFLNVNASASAVDRLDLALGVLLVADHNLDLVALADGEGAHIVLFDKVLREPAAHHGSTDTAGSGEIGLSGLSALAGYT
jgi:hypothetical protein